MNIILGAGLSGLICGALNAQSNIYERNEANVIEHRAVLRFRSDEIAKALGLAFRRVTVRKAIWEDGLEVDPSPRLANLYSRKARRGIFENSIWNMEPSVRYIAPDDLHAILADLCGKRVTWQAEIGKSMLETMIVERHSIISTIPLPYLLSLLEIDTELEFKYAPINVARFQIEDCDVYQTIYFPEHWLGVYRATLTGSLLTVESTTKDLTERELGVVLEAFGIQASAYTSIMRKHTQTFGKITAVHNEKRKALLHHITKAYGIYMLGRFATWRNILLDDVYDDIFHIRKMATMFHYDINLERIKS